MPLIDSGECLVADLARRQTRRAIDLARAQLVDRGAAEIDGFISPAVMDELVGDAERLAPKAYWSEGMGPAYLEPAQPFLPANHPRQWRGRHRLGVVSYDLFPPGSPLRRLYEWAPLREFVGAVLQRGPIFPYADPFGALNLAVMKEGDELQWHFDQTDFVVSLALRSARSGGEFEVVPRVRHSGERVAEVLGGRRHDVQVLPMRPGTLLIFEGRNSLHRVSRVSGPAARLVALLAYDTEPNRRGTEALHLERYGRTEPSPIRPL